MKTTNYIKELEEIEKAKQVNTEINWDNITVGTKLIILEKTYQDLNLKDKRFWHIIFDLEQGFVVTKWSEITLEISKLLGWKFLESLQKYLNAKRN